MKHKQERVNARRLQQLLDNDVTKEDLAKACGVHKNAVTAWLRLDDAPYWTEYVCEALERRHNEKRTMVCLVDGKFVETISIVVKAHGGRVYVIEG